MAFTTKPQIADKVNPPTGILTKSGTSYVTKTNPIYSHDLTGPSGPGGGSSPQGGSGYAAPPPPPVTQTTNTGTAGGGAGDDHSGEFDENSLDALEAQAILDQIAMIEAQTGLTAEQLMADQTEIGRQYRMYAEVAKRQFGRNQEAVSNQAAERGLGRSGIHAKQQSDLLQQFIEWQNQQAADEAAKQAQIDFQIKQNELQRQQDVANAIQAGAGTSLTADEIAAAASGGL